MVKKLFNWQSQGQGQQSSENEKQCDENVVLFGILYVKKSSMVAASFKTKPGSSGACFRPSIINNREACGLQSAAAYADELGLKLFC